MKIDTSIKGIFQALVYAVGCVYAWLDTNGINTYVFTVLFGFMGLDIFLGWIKASVVKGLPNPTSKIAKKGILVKILLLLVPAIVGLVYGAFNVENAFKAVNMFLIALMIAEAYSNIANIYMIYTGEVLSEFDAVTFVIKKAGNKLKKLIEAILK